MGNNQPDDETVGLFHTVLERCLNHEAFDSATRSRINTWRQQVLQMWPPLGSLHEHSRSAPGRKWSHPPYPNGLSTESVGRGRPLQAPANRFNCSNTITRQSSPPVLASSFPVGAESLLNSMHRLSGENNSTSASFFAKRPSLQDTLTEVIWLVIFCLIIKIHLYAPFVCVL